MIGGGDYAADRILPDAVRALMDSRPISVRNPEATRPWQHVLDCLSGYLWLGARLAVAEPAGELAAAFNFGPRSGANRPVRDLVDRFLCGWPGRWERLQTGIAPHEAAQLNLAIDRAAARLEWRPTWEFEEAVDATVDWYAARHVRGLGPEEQLEFTRNQIRVFGRQAAQRGLKWACGGK